MIHNKITLDQIRLDYIRLDQITLDYITLYDQNMNILSQ